MAKLNHIKELDGARGVAIIVVMLFHFVHVPLLTHNVIDRVFVNVLHLGWIGVDLFFVLSGYLISRILLSEKENQRFAGYIGTFYQKRALRIFPLYYAYLIFVFFIFFPLIADKLNTTDHAKLIDAQNAQVWFWLYLSNIEQVFTSKYFGANVSHLWTLSIEEQFYIIWPFIIYYLDTKNIKRLSAFILISLPLLRILFLLKGMPYISVYIFTLTRMDALAMGALIATMSFEGLSFDNKKLRISLLILTPITLILIYVYGIRPDNNFFVCSIGYSFLAIIFGLLVLMLQSVETYKNKVLFKNSFLIFMGKYSYALYIFHPLIRNLVLRIFPPFTVQTTQLPWILLFIVICTTGSVIIALLSWNLFEKWFLKIKNRIQTGKRNRALVYSDNR